MMKANHAIPQPTVALSAGRLAERGARPIPLARGLPVLGSGLSLLRNPLRFFLAESQRLGPVFRVRAAHRNMVILSGLEANRFMSEEGRDCFESAGFWARLVDEWQCPHFISAMDGSPHIEERRAYKSSMSRNVADAHQEGLIDVVTETVRSATAGGDAVSVRELARNLTNGSLYYLLTGERSDLEPSLTRALADYQRITFNVLVLGKWPRIALLSPHYLLCKRRSLAFVRSLRRQYRKKPPEGGFFKSALEQHRAHPERKDSDLDFAFLAPFWAGLDTLGASFVFLIHQLVHDSHLDLQVRGEIDHAVHDGDFRGIPSAAQLRKLPKLFGLCMETLRLYPVGFGNGRRAARDFDFGGYRVRKGEDVLVFTTATHFDGHYFRNPQVFDIERYSPPRNEHRTKYAFNPYGRGPHICLGAGMAESMMLTAVATMLYSFEFEAVAPKKRYGMIFDPSPTLPGAFEIRIRERVTPLAAHRRRAEQQAKSTALGAPA